MAVERALTLYLLNGTTVDTGTGVVMKLLSAANGGTNDVTQTANALHSQDNIERTWTPALGGVGAAADCTALQKKGWALRLTNDMTPGDDTNCNVLLPAQTLTVPLDVGLSWSGASIAANPNPTFKAALFRYDPATDTGTLIGSGSIAQSWNNLTENGTFKTVTASITLAAAVEFLQGEILLLQAGFNTGTLPNPVSGTVTYVFTLRVDNSTTKVAFAAASGLRQACVLSSSPVGEGLASRSALPVELATLLATGEGLGSRVLAGAVARDSVGEGLSSRVLAGDLSRSPVGEGLSSAARALTAARTADVIGEGLTSRGAILLSKDLPVIGEGLASAAKATVAAKSLAVVGEGLASETHPVQASRTADVGGRGEIPTSGSNASTITVPLDELGGGGTTTVVRPVLIFDD